MLRCRDQKHLNFGELVYVAPLRGGRLEVKRPETLDFGELEQMSRVDWECKARSSSGGCFMPNPNTPARVNIFKKPATTQLTPFWFQLVTDFFTIPKSITCLFLVNLSM